MSVLFYRLQCFPDDPTVSSELKPSADETFFSTCSLYNEPALTPVGAL